LKRRLYRDLLEQADVILTTATNKGIIADIVDIIYGKQLLQEAMAIDNLKQVNVVTVEVHMDTGEYKWLLEAVNVIKGSCDIYQSQKGE
jgi:hypothetical protein